MRAKRVLLIDDDQWLAELFKTTLEAAGYAVDVAHDALKGMSQVDERRPDLIVLDIFMPGPNGVVLLHELQSYVDTAEIPVVLCTNSAVDIAQEQLRPYGVRQVLDKTTMEPGDIVTAVRKYA